ncbi:hypothetical protein SLA2020_228530 [Shorea laevis]
MGEAPLREPGGDVARLLAPATTSHSRAIYLAHAYPSFHPKNFLYACFFAAQTPSVLLYPFTTITAFCPHWSSAPTTNAKSLLFVVNYTPKSHE